MVFNKQRRKRLSNKQNCQIIWKSCKTKVCFKWGSDHLKEIIQKEGMGAAKLLAQEGAQNKNQLFNGGL